MKYCQMKKIIVLMLVVAFVFTLSACNNKNIVSDSDTDTSTSTSSETFVKPESYTSVLLVSINPQFKLYLDENNNVLAIEPVNDDAKSFSKSIDFENKTVEAVVGNIVEKANEKGFIKENVTVDFEITEQKNGIDNSYILTKVVSAVNQKATELKIEIKTEIKESDKSQITETNSENTQTAENSKPTTSSKTEESTSKPSTTSKPGGSKPTHTHIFSAATCTQPKTCSCGATEGKPLGHKWISATCKVAKTCSVCKLTEGNKAAHKYVKGICSVCKHKDPNFKEYLSGKYTAQYLSNPLSNPIYNGSPLKYNIVSIEILNHRDNMEHCDVEFKQREYYLFDYAFDEGWFEDNPEYEIWEGNSKRPPTREEALRIGTNSGDIITYNSKNYCFPSGDGGYDNMVVLTKNSLTFFDGLTVNYDYDGYDTLKLISIPDDSIFATWEVKTNCVFTKEN